MLDLHWVGDDSVIGRLVPPGASLLPPHLPNTSSEYYLRLVVVTMLNSRDCFLHLPGMLGPGLGEVWGIKECCQKTRIPNGALEGHLLAW